MNTPMEELLQSIRKWRSINSAKIDEMIINRLLEHSSSLDNYTHIVLYTKKVEVESGYFTLYGKEVLRYCKLFDNTIDNLTMYCTTKYEVYDYIANEFLYIEQ